ncbi:MAG: hypothetical protein WBV85_12315 [Solirubrobacteraceae bacterium]
MAIVSILSLGAIRAFAAERPAASPNRGAPRSPSGPVLGSGSGLIGEASASAPSSGGDPLAGNGLDSPLCRAPGGLSAVQRRSCETDSFVAAPDPTNDYAFDVNINTGVGKWGNDMSATIDDFAQFGWMALVSATHGLVVMFEWCYSLNLLSGALLGQVTVALRNARLTFTEPWLVLVLAVASMLVVYHGLVKRQIAETMGQALAMLAMMAGGLWVISDPAGTVGAVGQWTNQAGLGAMAVAANGTPDNPERTLADNMEVVFASAITAPWCYLEFGDVRWCDETDQLDGGLKQAGLVIAKGEEQKSGCRDGCSVDVATGTRELFTSSQLLREAQTNGELFLALPANEPGRNSVTKKGTLLNVLCGGGKSADECKGPTAPQAEFRSQKGTGSRVIGLFAIWLGALGMLLLLGFLALRLLGAAVTGLFFLLLAPVAVLAPALGDGGRSAFRGWALKLLEAVVAKLTYSFLLGVVLLVMKLLLSLTLLGWWGQWLLVSAFWWGIFFKRHQTFGWAHGSVRGRPPTPHRSMARQVGEALETPRALFKPLVAMRKRRQPAPETDPPKPHSQPSAASRSRSESLSSTEMHAGLRDPVGTGGSGERQGGRALAERGRGAGVVGFGKSDRSKTDLTTGERAHVGASGARMRHSADQRLDAQSASANTGLPAEVDTMVHGRQLKRVRRERQKALAKGDTRRVAKLAAREQRIEDEQPRRRTPVSAFASATLDSRLESRNSAPVTGATKRPLGQASGVGSVADASVRFAPGPGASRPDRESVGRRSVGRSSSVMDDAREVAARRKRQLGWGTDRPGPGKVE